MDAAGQEVQGQAVVHALGRLAQAQAVVGDVGEDLDGQGPVPGIDAREVAGHAGVEDRQGDRILTRHWFALDRPLRTRGEPAARRIRASASDRTGFGMTRLRGEPPWFATLIGAKAASASRKMAGTRRGRLVPSL